MFGRHGQKDGIAVLEDFVEVRTDPLLRAQGESGQKELIVVVTVDVLADFGFERPEEYRVAAQGDVVGHGRAPGARAQDGDFLIFHDMSFYPVAPPVR